MRALVCLLYLADKNPLDGIISFDDMGHASLTILALASLEGLNGFVPLIGVMCLMFDSYCV